MKVPMWLQMKISSWKTGRQLRDWDKLKAGIMTKAEFTRKYDQDLYDCYTQSDDYESMYEWDETLKEDIYTSKGMTRAEFASKWGLEVLEDLDLINDRGTYYESLKRGKSI